ncbi:MAG: hypothetical protein J6Q52_04015 [Clostridia bacterium]|nr:hypothetical protein [Clostridia bacterium]
MMSKTKSIISLVLIGVFMVVFGLLSLLPMDSGYYAYPAVVGNLSKDNGSAHTTFAEYRIELLDDADEDAEYDSDKIVSKLDAYLTGRYSATSVSYLGNDRIRIETPYDEAFSATLVSALTYKTIDLIPEDLDSKELTDADYIKYAITAEDIESVEMGMTASYAYGVSIKMTEDAIDKLADTTSKYKGKTFYLRLDGTKSVTISDMANITDGNITISSTQYTYDSASNLTANILAATLGAKLQLTSSGTVAPVFGDKFTADLGISALLALIVAIIIFVIKYRLAGLAMGISTVALALVYLLGMVLAFSIPVGTAVIIALAFSLITGVYLADICMQNVRAEYEKNPVRSPIAIVKLAFSKGFKSVIDATIVVVLMAIAMTFLGLNSATLLASAVAMGVVLSVLAVMMTAGIILLFMGIGQSNLKAFGFGDKIEIEEV